MYEWRNLAFRSTCTTDCRRNIESCVGVEFALDQHHSFLVPSRVSTSRRSLSACSQTSTPSNLCAMISMMLTTAFRIIIVPMFTLVSIAYLQNHEDARGQRSRRWSSRIHALRSDVWMSRSSVWGSMAGRLLLEPLQTRQPLSRSRSVARAHVQEHSDKHCNVNSGTGIHYLCHDTQEISVLFMFSSSLFVVFSSFFIFLCIYLFSFSLKFSCFSFFLHFFLTDFPQKRVQHQTRVRPFFSFWCSLSRSSSSTFRSFLNFFI